MAAPRFFLPGKVLARFQTPDHLLEGLRVGRLSYFLNSGVYFFRIGDTLIDTGCSNAGPVVIQYLKKHPVSKVIVSHHHEDHAGNGAAIKELLSIPIYAPLGTIPALKNPEPIEYYRRFFWGATKPFDAEPYPGRIGILNGYDEVIPIPTLGHSFDHHCFFVPGKKWLFAADLYVTGKPKVARFDENIHQEMESLEGILRNNFHDVFCAHRGWIPNGRRALETRLKTLSDLSIRVDKLAAAGVSVSEITKKVLGSEALITYVTHGDFSKRNLVQAIINRGTSGQSDPRRK